MISYMDLSVALDDEQELPLLYLHTVDGQKRFIKWADLPGNHDGL